MLLVDDEHLFRRALGQQLAVRGFDVLDVDSGEEAIKVVRHENPGVVVLDQRMPGMDGIQTLREIKKIRPEVQVIMLTGHGSTESARVSGKHDVFHYLQKPCAVDELVSVINAAREERVYALARHEIPAVKKAGFRQWLAGAHHHRPGVMLLGLAVFAGIVAGPPFESLTALLAAKKTDQVGEKIGGYSEYRKLKAGQSIADYYSAKAGLYRKSVRDGAEVKEPITPEQAAFRARVMIGVLVVAALFWATGAIPIGMTALLVGVLMYFFDVLPANLVAQSYAKDSVVFIFGVLAIAVAIGKTGLDRRIGLLLLGQSSSLAKFAFIFAPLLAMTASFLSEHALVAFLAPILMLVYLAAINAAGLKRDRELAVMMMLLLTFSGNVGGPGSPAAGGRNAVMLGILTDYGITVSFGYWVKMGFPFVPVMALTIAAYFYLAFRKRIRTPNLDIAARVREESRKIGRMTRDEYKAAAALAVLVVLWVTMSDRLGMGGPALFCIVLMNVLGIIRWRDINKINWDVVALYAAATAMGYGLAMTGAALWLADGLVSALPAALKSGIGLCMSCSMISGLLTNFMSDGATVATVGPITVPMAALSGTSPLLVGLATAFASSFAHMLVIGTPNNAIVYSMARDPETGEQLVTMRDFLVHGFVVLVLSFAVLWGWVFFGYWRWMGV